MPRNYRARCTICSWISRLNQGPVFAGWDALAHAKKEHPNDEGIVALIENISVYGDETHEA